MKRYIASNARTKQLNNTKRLIMMNSKENIIVAYTDGAHSNKFEQSGVGVFLRYNGTDYFLNHVNNYFMDHKNKSQQIFLSFKYRLLAFLRSDKVIMSVHL